MSLSDKLVIGALAVVPQHGLSRLTRRLVEVRSPAAVRWFAGQFGIDLAEAEHPIDHYGSILELFTRRLKPGLRPLDPDPAALLCPVDGVLDAFGSVQDGLLLQAKGRSYTLAALLADEALAAQFEGGTFSTLYLSPKDYHRVHSPADVAVSSVTHVPGALWPVNQRAVREVDGLFAKNERLVMLLESERFGRMAYVMVGATNVGHMRLYFDEDVVTNVPRPRIGRKEYTPPRPLARGAELGVFEMGSTVILITTNRFRFEPSLESGAPVRVGQRLGRV